MSNSIQQKPRDEATTAIIDDTQIVFKGQYNKKLSSVSRLRQIRLFLWSTKSDFDEERELFWFEILPELQHHCLQYGAEVLVFDPYQGSDFDPVYQPQLLNLLYQQIHECRRQSEGVFFVCLIGDKYGICPLPPHIRTEEFQHIRTAAFEGGKDVRLLDEWYKLDQNINPPVFLLQASSSKKKLDTKTFEQLQELIQQGAYAAHKDGLINQVTHKYQERFFTSMVQMAIENALCSGHCGSSSDQNIQSNVATSNAISTFSWTSLASKANAAKCLFVLRKLDGVQPEAIAKLKDYFDPTSNHPCWNPQERLTNLKNSLSTAADKANLETFRVQCDSSDPSSWQLSKKRDRYLESFTLQVSYKLKQLIDAAFIGKPIRRNTSLPSLASSYQMLRYAGNNNNNNNVDSCLRSVYETALMHHQHLLSMKTVRYVGGNDLLKKLRDLCKEQSRKPGPPLILRGDDGSGRTALMAEIAWQVSTNWLIGSTVVCRFVGLNARAQFVHELLRDVCLQLCYAHQLDDLLSGYREHYSVDKMAEWLEVACAEIVRKSGQPVVLLIDDLHQVKYGPNVSNRGQQQQGWLPCPLPAGVIVACTVGTSAPVDQLPIRRWDNSKGVFQLVDFTEADLLEMIKARLGSVQRTIAVEQEGALKGVFRNCSSVVLAKLLAHESSQWPSFQQIHVGMNNGSRGNGLSATSLAAYLDQKFDILEKQYGYEVCQHTCCYLECGQNGITECELLDLLSCQREVMNKIYPEHGAARLRRFPSNLWLRFKNDLGLLINYKIADGKTLFYWSHTLITNCVRHRYLNSSAQLKKCHNDLAALFTNTWIDAEHEQSVDSSTEGKTVHRFVMPQPLSCNPDGTHLPMASGDGVVYNLRRVHSLWYHLLNSGSVDYFEEQSLFNFEYLQALLQAAGLSHLLSVMEYAMSQILNYNLHVLYGMVLRPSPCALSNEPSLFAAEVIGRLRSNKGRNTPTLNHLVEQAMAWVDGYSHSPMMVPLAWWIKPPLCPLVVTFKLQEWSSDAVGSETIVQPTINDQHLLVAGNKSVHLIWMYHVASHTLVKTFIGHHGRIICLEIAHNGQQFVSSSLDSTVRIWDIQMGTCVQTFNPHNDRTLAVMFTNDDQYLVTSGVDKKAKITCLETGRTLRVFEGHTSAVTSLALTCADDYLITGSSDFTVFVWSMENGKKMSQIGGLMAPVRCIRLTSNDTFLLVACDDETLKVFSLCLGTEIHELRGHEGKIYSMVIASDDCQAFAGSSDGNIYCYDIHSGQLLSTQNCHATAVTSLKVTASGHFVISGSADSVHVWNIDRTSDAHRRQDEAHQLTVIGMSKDMKYAGSGNFAGLVYLWDMETCQCLWITYDEPPSPVTCLQFDPDNVYLFSGASNGVVSVWSMADGSQLKRYENHTTTVTTIQIFSDRSRVLSHEANGIAKVWLLHSNKQPTTVGGGGSGGGGGGGSGDADDGEKDGIVDVITLKSVGDLIRLANDKELVVKAVDADKEIRICNISNEEETVAMKARLCHTDPITCMTISSDGKLVVTGSIDQSLKVWEGSTGYLTQVLVGHNDSIVHCAINDSCTIVVSACADHSVYSWDVDTGAIIAAFNDHKDSVSSVVLPLDGNVAISGSKDGWLHAWATETGHKITSFHAHMPIADILTATDAHRILLRLEQCPYMAIVCLHNSPAFPEPVSAKKRRQSRAMSMTSLASTNSLSSIGSSRDPAPSSNHANGGQSMTKDGPNLGATGVRRGERSNVEKSTRTDRKPSKVFAQLERSRSKASLLDNPTSITRPERTSKEKPSNKQSASNNSSKICVIL